VHDLTGTHRDEYFYSTDVTMTPQAIIELRICKVAGLAKSLLSITPAL
jgi:hypothetical protein